MKSTNSAKNLEIRFSKLYLSALRKYLRQSPGSDLEAARILGRDAVSNQLETLDVARIHEVALTLLLLPDDSFVKNAAKVGRAGLFFAEAITPIEKTHRGAIEASNHLNRIVADLSLRTLELASTVAELKREVLHRKEVEESLRTNEGVTSRLLENSLVMQDDLRRLSRQLLSAQEEERRKISRELHDVIAQTLTGINMRLAELKAESAASTVQLRKKITSTQKLVEKSVGIVHRFARELRPSMLDDLGLIPALQSFMKGFMEDTGVRATLLAFAQIEESSANLRTALYRVAQEALTNVARHAKASNVEVKIRNLDGIIVMEVTDDGIGFEVEGKSRAKRCERLGLLGMRERIEMVGGTFRVESAPGHATTVRVEIPPGKNRPMKTHSLKKDKSTPQFP